MFAVVAHGSVSLLHRTARLSSAQLLLQRVNKLYFSRSCAKLNAKRLTTTLITRKAATSTSPMVLPATWATKGGATKLTRSIVSASSSTSLVGRSCSGSRLETGPCSRRASGPPSVLPGSTPRSTALRASGESQCSPWLLLFYRLV